ncbi:MAG: radical SAM protein [Peptoniphilaceae bacterium]|nr:radical SAM protein [Peptoniphilaceae bacterium]MDY6019147.1 radical SAM protein [Anaerococcus sp.]
MLKKSDFLIVENNNYFYVFYKNNLSIKKLDKSNYTKFQSIINKLDDMTNYELKSFENYINNTFVSKKHKKSTNLKRTDYLSKLEIILNNKCNLACKYCYANGGDYNQEKNDIKPEKIGYLVSKIIPKYFSKVGTVMFFGGEPLLSFETIKQTVKEFEFLYNSMLIKTIPRFTIVTNGTLITKEIAEFFNENNFYVTISIDGESYIHNILRPFKNGEGSFNKVNDAIFLLRRHNVNIQLLEVTYTKLHIDNNISKTDIESFLKNKYGDIKIFISDCIGDSEYSIDEKCINNSEISYNKQVKLATLRAVLGKEYKRNYCDAGLESIAITPLGKIIPCHFFMGYSKYIIGDLNKSNIFYSNYDQLADFFDNLKTYYISECSKCWIKDMCSECPASLLIYNKDNKLEHCEEKRRIRAYIIRDLIRIGEIY